MQKQSTYNVKVSDIKRNWHILDASEQPLGRIASKAAALLRGKHKVQWAPYLDCGDFVIIINSAKVKLTGNKRNNKMYHRFTGYLGGMKHFTAGFMVERRPHFLMEQAVRCMLPTGPLGKQMLTKCKIYKDDKHPHAAQTKGVTLG